MMILPFLLPALPPDPEALESADLPCSQGSMQEALRFLSKHDWTENPGAVLLLEACFDTIWPVQGSTPLPGDGTIEFSLLPSGRTSGFQLARSLSISGSRGKGADA